MITIAMKAGTWICLAAMGLLVAIFFGMLLSKVKKRAERINFLRSFKIGKCTFIYVPAVLLYWIGHVYAGQDFWGGLFSAVGKIVQLVVLRYDTNSIKPLLEVYPLYRATVYICFALVLVNALIFAFSLAMQYFWYGLHFFKTHCWRWSDKLYLLGNNEGNISVYVSEKRRKKILIAENISREDGVMLYMRGVAHLSFHTYDNVIRDLFRKAAKQSRERVWVVNTGDDERNIHICRLIVELLQGMDDEDKKNLFLKTKVFVFGDPRYEAVYEEIVTGALGCIHYVNKYQKIAMDFIDRYPFAAFLDERQVDYSTSLIKKDVQINAMFIGFGKTGRQLFMTSLANNQFLTQGENGPVAKHVKYYIFDKDKAQNDKNFNHGYYRYKNEIKGFEAQAYLDLPDFMEEEYRELDVNDPDFYYAIKEIASGGPNDVNFAIIAFGTDLENLDMAQKLMEKRREWGISNLVILVKTRCPYGEKAVAAESGCYFIGNEAEVVYNVDTLVADKISHMAQMRNEVYDLEYAITHGAGAVIDEAYVQKNHEDATRNWFLKKTQMERESSLYCCLSLRSKLLLMGLDYCPKDTPDAPALTEAEYEARYAGADLPDEQTYGLTVKGKHVICYTLEFPDSRRKSMAIHEHQRWNFFMISKGIIPASRDKIKNEISVDENGKVRHTNGKNYIERRHGALTTFEGLVEYRQIIAARDGCPEAEADVIKYDYQLLDDAYWLLDQNGYKIVERKRQDTAYWLLEVRRCKYMEKRSK